MQNRVGQLVYHRLLICASPGPCSMLGVGAVPVNMLQTSCHAMDNHYCLLLMTIDPSDIVSKAGARMHWCIHQLAYSAAALLSPERVLLQMLLHCNSFQRVF
jgi:hypothetical protein